MAATKSQIADLSTEQQTLLQSYLTTLKSTWNEDRLSGVVPLLPPAPDVLRQPALAELVKVDLRLQWQEGHEVYLQSYWETYPELGTADTVAVELIVAEYSARKKAGHAPDFDALLKRFPQQSAELRRLAARKKKGKSGESQLSLAASETQSFNSSTNAGPQSPAQAARLPEQFGRYRIVRRLGQGAMGDVYLAEDTQLNRQVALKVPKLEKENKALLDRFYREARAAAGLHHPNICPVHDVGEIDGVHFLTMAYIEGRPLSAYVKAGKPLPVRAVVAIVRKLTLALSEAHARGILHRDLKPSNIMTDKMKQPVVMDFGLALSVNSEQSRLTKTGAILGTPAYMPPEQVKGELDELGPASDVYSLGIIFYELLTGQVPFEGPIASVLGQILAVDPRPPSAHRKNLDPKLDEICLKAMAKPIDERFTSMAEFAQALTDWARASNRDSPVPLEVVPEAKPSADDTVLPTADENMDHLFQSFAGDENSQLGSILERGRTTTRRKNPIMALWNRTHPIYRWTIASSGVAALLILGAIIVIHTPGTTVEIDTQEEKTTVVALNDKITVKTTPTDQQAKPDEKPKPQTGTPPEPKKGQGEGPPAVDESSLTKNDDPAPETSDAKAEEPAKPTDSEEHPPPPIKPAKPATNESPDHVAAKWVLGIGGTITVFPGDTTISKAEDIPIGEFELIKADLYGNKNVDDVGLSNLSGLTHIEELGLNSTPVGNAGLAHLRDLKTLKVLELGSTSVSDAGLANLSGLTAITKLILWNTLITDDGLRYLQPILQLQTLNLDGTHIKGDGLSVLAGISTLEDLSLSKTRLTDDGLERVAELRNLQELNLNGTSITDAGLRHLKVLTHLATLYLADCEKIVGTALNDLAEIPGLTTLSLYGTQVTDATVSHLTQFPNLSDVTLDFTQITDRGLLTIAKINSLTYLTLSGLEITDADLKTIAKMKELRSLGLSHTKITDAGLKYLKKLSRLDMLILNGTRVSDEGIRSLRTMKQLSSLQIADCAGITAKGYSQLKSALPQCDIYSDYDE